MEPAHPIQVKLHASCIYFLRYDYASFPPNVNGFDFLLTPALAMTFFIVKIFVPFYAIYGNLQFVHTCSLLYLTAILTFLIKSLHGIHIDFTKLLSLSLSPLLTLASVIITSLLAFSTFTFACHSFSPPLHPLGPMTCPLPVFGAAHLPFGESCPLKFSLFIY